MTQRCSVPAQGWRWGTSPPRPAGAGPGCCTPVASGQVLPFSSGAGPTNTSGILANPACHPSPSEAQGVGRWGSAHLHRQAQEALAPPAVTCPPAHTATEPLSPALSRVPTLESALCQLCNSSLPPLLFQERHFRSLTKTSFWTLMETEVERPTWW